MNAHTKTFTEWYRLISVIEGWLALREALFLFTAASKIKTGGMIVEIGSYKGKSTVALFGGATRNGAHITTIDPHQGIIHQNGRPLRGGTYRDFLKNLKYAGITSGVTPVVATSAQAAGKFHKTIDFVFIDGLHDYDHAHEDCLLWEPKLADGGIIAFHDAYCGHTGVFRMVRELVFPDSHYSDFGIAGSILYARKCRGNPVIRFVRIFLIQLGHTFFNLTIIPKYFRFQFSHRLIKLLLYSSVDQEMQDELNR